MQSTNDDLNRERLEPTLGGTREWVDQMPTSSKDPRVVYLESGAWRKPFDKLPAEFVDAAMAHATVIVVDVLGDPNFGAVLAFEPGNTEMPVVLLPMDESIWDKVLRCATELGTPTVENSTLAIHISDLGPFSQVPTTLTYAFREVWEILQET